MELIRDKNWLVPRLMRTKYTLLCRCRYVGRDLRTALIPVRCLLIGMGELQNDDITSGRADDLHTYRKTCARKTTPDGNRRQTVDVERRRIAHGLQFHTLYRFWSQ